MVSYLTLLLSGEDELLLRVVRACGQGTYSYTSSPEVIVAQDANSLCLRLAAHLSYLKRSSVAGRGKQSRVRGSRRQGEHWERNKFRGRR